jgi:hypothetical protein
MRCSACGATWESGAAAVEIWREGSCLACGAPMERTPDEANGETREPPSEPD